MLCLPTIAYNCYGLAEPEEFERRECSNLLQEINRIPNVEACKSAPILADPCL